MSYREIAAPTMIAAVADYVTGESGANISRRYGCGKTTVIAWVRAAGHPVRVRSADARMQRVRCHLEKVIRDGAGDREAARMVGCHYQTAGKVRRSLGIPRKPVGYKPDETSWR